MPDARPPAACLNCYQVKIDPTPRKWTGSVFEDYGGKSWEWYYTLSNNPVAREAFKIGAWNTFRVEAIGPSIKVWLCGFPLLSAGNCGVRIPLSPPFYFGRAIFSANSSAG